MTRTFPGVPWCRYADDGLIHCETDTQAHAVLAALTDQLAACGLAIHPDKTHVVYCKDGSRKERRPNTKFDFLGGGQRESPQSHAGDRATVELSQSNGTELAGHLPAAQSRPAGMGGLLWEVLPLGDVSGLQVLQQDVGGLGYAKVQTTEKAQDAGKSAPRTPSREATAPVHTLAARNRGRVCLMGAV